ncbi:MAG: hypothetical protein GSR72_01680 [Desulfurococcales archaeon]|nr:hypothetical protein [Desulfurococcales archaeon]MEB3788585.1 hypothetical protein [Desulfurococcales archaeon]
MMVDDQEPTPGTGPCLEELGIVDKEDAIASYALLEPQEDNIVDLLLYSDEGLEVYVQVFIGLDCLHIIALHLRGCGSKSVETLKKYSDKPEFTKIIMEGECIDLEVPPYPRIRIERALSLVNLKPPLPILAYRRVDKFVLED